MSVDRRTAKALCTADEFKIYELSQPAKLKKLTQVELRDLIVRSRTLRKKWTDLSRGQRRASQAAKGGRQNDENARSKRKAELFSEVHNSFVNYLEKVKSGEAELPTGKKPPQVPRQDRKIVNRAVRSITQDQLDQVKGKINRSNRASEGTTVKKAKPKSKSATGAARTTKKASSVKSASSSGATKKTAVKSRAAASSPAKKKSAKLKRPALTAARKKAFAKRAEIVSATAPKKLVSSKANRGPEVDQISKAGVSARNRSPHAKATATRVARGGATRIQGHVSAKGKRSQARRDKKG